MVYGYIRVSSGKQAFENQRFEIKITSIQKFSLQSRTAVPQFHKIIQQPQ